MISVRSQTLEQIISNHLEARGGLEKIKSLRSLIMRGHSVSEPFELPINFYCIHEKAFKVEIQYEGRNFFQMGTVTEGWSYSPNQADSMPQRMSIEELQKGQEYFDLHGPFIDYIKKGNRLEYTGTKKINNKDFLEVKLTRPNGHVMLYYLDEQYLISQTVETLEDSIDKITTYSNYKKTSSGLVFPFTWSISHSSTQIDAIEVNPTIDINMFKLKKYRG